MGYALSIGQSPRQVARIGLAVLSGQLAIGWQNDWTDAGRDRLVGRADKPVVSGEVPAHLVGAAALTAGALCLPASLANGRRAGLIHLLAVLSAASYNAGLKATPASFAPYALSFSLLPVFAQRAGVAGRRAPWWAPAAAGSLGVAAHLLNVLPDREQDRELGIYGLPQRLNPETDLALAGGLLALSSLLITTGGGRADPLALGGLAASLGLGAALLLVARQRADRSPFRLVLVLALLDVAQLLLAAHRSR